MQVYFVVKGPNGLLATYPGKGQRKDDRSEALDNFQWFQLIR